MDFVDRLKVFIASSGLANSQFADKAGIPRPSLSQILNGRNKKISNEFIAKLHATFPELNVLWLMFGDGDMTTNTHSLFSDSSDGGESTESKAQSSGPQPYASTEIARNSIQEINTNKFDAQSKTDNLLFDSSMGDEFDLNTSLYTESPEAAPINFSQEDGLRNDNDNFNIAGNTYRNPSPQPASAYQRRPNTYTQQEPRQTETANFQQPHSMQESNGQQQIFQSPNQSGKTQAPTTGSNIRFNAAPDSSESTGARIPLNVDTSKRVAYIMVFYTDNSFEIFRPSGDATK